MSLSADFHIAASYEYLRLQGEVQATARLARHSITHYKCLVSTPPSSVPCLHALLGCMSADLSLSYSVSFLHPIFQSDLLMYYKCLRFEVFVLTMDKPRARRVGKRARNKDEESSYV